MTDPRLDETPTQICHDKFMDCNLSITKVVVHASIVVTKRKFTEMQLTIWKLQKTIYIYIYNHI